MSKQVKHVDLQAELAKLDKDIRPTRELWSGIELAIEHQEQNNQPSRKRFSAAPLAWAASIIIAVMATWQFSPSQGNAVELPASVVAMQSQFNQDRASLLVSLGQPNIGELSDELKQQFEQIDSAKKSLQASIAEDPNNVDLVNLLKWLNQQELELLEQLYKPKWQTI